MANDEPINNFMTNNRGSSHPGAKANSRATRGERTQPTPIGRYDRRSHNTRVPSQGLARTGLPKNRDLVVAAVDDPYGDGRERVYATIDRRVDLLEQERSHGRITEAAYRTGRLIQAVFERLGTTGTSSWEGGGTGAIDPLAQQARFIRMCDDTREIMKIADRISNRIGVIDTRLLRRLLGDRLGFAACAGLQGKSGERGERYIAGRFRDALEDLAEAWTGRGKVPPPPDDKHAAAAIAMDARRSTVKEQAVEAATDGE